VLCKDIESKTVLYSQIANIKRFAISKYKTSKLKYRPIQHVSSFIINMVCVEVSASQDEQNNGRDYEVD